MPRTPDKHRSSLGPALLAALLAASLTLAATSALASSACDVDTPIDDDAPYSVTFSFWAGSQINGTDVPSDLEPRKVLEFTWTDPQECFVWIRDVSDEIGGGKRTNVASKFSFKFEGDTVALTYYQNSGECCAEFTGTGNPKTFYSDHLVIDETTGQTGDPLWVAVTGYRTPNNK